MKRNPTEKKLNDKTNSTIDKGTNGKLVKSNTKGELLKNKNTTITPIKDKKGNDHKELPKNETENTKNGKDNHLTVPGRHPTREENISGMIGVSVTNDELLTKEDSNLLTGLQEKTDQPPEPKIDKNEILDDKWANFKK